MDPLVPGLIPLIWPDGPQHLEIMIVGVVLFGVIAAVLIELWQRRDKRQGKG
jgi:hypothetical protein